MTPAVYDRTEGRNETGCRAIGYETLICDDTASFWLVTVTWLLSLAGDDRAPMSIFVGAKRRCMGWALPEHYHSTVTEWRSNGGRSTADYQVMDGNLDSLGPKFLGDSDPPCPGAHGGERLAFKLNLKNKQLSIKVLRTNEMNSIDLVAEDCEGKDWVPVVCLHSDRCTVTFGALPAQHEW